MLSFYWDGLAWQKRDMMSGCALWNPEPRGQSGQGTRVMTLGQFPVLSAALLSYVHSLELFFLQVGAVVVVTGD